MKPTNRQLTGMLRLTLWGEGVLIAVFVLSLIVCGLLALVGDDSGRGAALALALVAFLGLILDLAAAVGVLSLLAIRNENAIDEESAGEE